MPNWRKDTRKTRVADNKCAFSGCQRPSVLNYCGFGLCEIHEDYYRAEDMPSPILKKILGLPVTASDHAEAVETRISIERDRRKSIKEAKEQEDEESFENTLFKFLDRKRRTKTKKDDEAEEEWEPDL